MATKMMCVMILGLSLDLASAFPQQPLAPQIHAQTTPSASSIPSYPNSEAGLENLINDMNALAKKGDDSALAPYYQSLVLPNSESWFDSKFGNPNCEKLNEMAANDCLGNRLALAYSAIASNIPASARMTMKDLIEENLTNFEAVNYSAPCPNPVKIIPDRKLVGELTTTPFLSPVLSGLMKNKEPIYILWSYSQTQETTIGFFVYSEDAFRYIGMPHPASADEYSHKRLSYSVKADDLTNEVVDAHPVMTDPALGQKTVVIHVVIGADGRVREADYARGPESLKDAAIRMAEEHHFKPVTFGGKPVPVSTCVNVVPPE